MIEQLRLKLGRYVLGWRLVSPGAHDHSHSELIDVVAAGDADEALRVLESHLNHVRDGVHRAVGCCARPRAARASDANDARLARGRMHDSSTDA